MREYEIFVPLKYNDGAAIEAHKLQGIQQALVAAFTGLTFLPQPNQGIWTVGDVTYYDEIVSTES